MDKDIKLIAFHVLSGSYKLTVIDRVNMIKSIWVQDPWGKNITNLEVLAVGCKIITMGRGLAWMDARITDILYKDKGYMLFICKDLECELIW